MLGNRKRNTFFSLYKKKKFGWLQNLFHVRTNKEIEIELYKIYKIEIKERIKKL